jgi:hypothetical protein
MWNRSSGMTFSYSMIVLEGEGLARRARILRRQYELCPDDAPDYVYDTTREWAALIIAVVDE